MAREDATGQEQQERYAVAVREQLGWQPVTGQFTLKRDGARYRGLVLLVRRGGG
jgi:hypothetical protein